MHDHVRFASAGGSSVRDHTELGLLLTLRRYVGQGRVVLVTTSVTLGVLAADPTVRPLVTAVAVLTYLCVAYELTGDRTLTRSAVPTIVTVLAVGLVQAWAGPPSGAGWAFATAAVTVICAQFEFATRPGLAWTVSAVATVSYTGGALVRAADPSPIGAGLRMLLEATLSFAAVLLLRQWARAADRSQRRAARYRRAERLARARRDDEQEYLTTLHDTASTTLLMVSLGVGDSGPEWIPDRASQDLQRLTNADLGDGPDVDLTPLLRTAAAHPDVEVRLRLADKLLVPAPIGLAVFHGILEAIQNVAVHAETATATLSAERDDGSLRVELADSGRGFVRAEVSRHRRGISGSIVGRMTAVGGHVAVASEPGLGTRITWTWHE